jgi:hypothetical protein
MRQTDGADTASGETFGIAGTVSDDSQPALTSQRDSAGAINVPDNGSTGGSITFDYKSIILQNSGTDAGV